MNTQIMLGYIFLACGAAYAAAIICLSVRRRDKLKKEKGNILALAAAELAVYFVASTGISDFLLNTLVIKRLKLSDDKGLPPTLVCAAIVPGTVMAFSYLRGANVLDPMMLGLFVLCVIAGSVLGSRLVSGMSGEMIKKLLGILLIASIFAVGAKMLISREAAGTLNSLRGWRLAVICLLGAVVGFINQMGVPGKPATTAVMLLLGMSPVTTITMVLVMGCITPIAGGIRVLRDGRYNERLALGSVTGGAIGAALGSIFVVSLDQTLLSVILMIVMAIAAASVLKK